MAVEDPATVCDGAFETGEGLEAQMIRYMRHGSPPRLMAPQPIDDPDRRESHPAPSTGNRMTGQGPRFAQDLGRDDWLAASLRPRAAAAVYPTLVRSRIRSRSNWPSAPNT